MSLCLSCSLLLSLLSLICINCLHHHLSHDRILLAHYLLHILIHGYMWNVACLGVHHMLLLLLHCKERVNLLLILCSKLVMRNLNVRLMHLLILSILMATSILPSLWVLEVFASFLNCKQHFATFISKLLSFLSKLIIIV